MQSPAGDKQQDKSHEQALFSCQSLNLDGKKSLPVSQVRALVVSSETDF